MIAGVADSSDAESDPGQVAVSRRSCRRRSRHPTNSGASSHASSLENTPTKDISPPNGIKKRKTSMAASGSLRLKSKPFEMRNSDLMAARRAKASRVSVSSALTKNRVNKAIRQSLPSRVNMMDTAETQGLFCPPRGLPDRGSPVLPLMEPCTVRNCDSRGHLSGRLPWHSTPAACPIYHGVSAEKCVGLAEERVSAMLSNVASAQEPSSITKRLRLSTARSSPEKKFCHVGVKRLKHLRKQSAASAAADPGAALLASAPSTSSTRSSAASLQQPSLNGLNVLACDRDLFLHSQAAAVEDFGFEQAINRALVAPPPSADDSSGQKSGDKSKKANYRLKWIVINGVRMAPWYQSPYPDEYVALDTLFVCEFCFRYYRTEAIYRRHSAKCVWRHPPGDEIYRKDDHSIFEVDGNAAKQYCQNLCLFAKLFIANKTLFYEVETFLFYVMTKNDPNGCHAVGYFSKEKHSLMNCNLSCLLVFPSQSRRGYGKFLIDFSYLLSRLEGRIGSPERPLSDLGLLTYRSYWKEVIATFLAPRMEAKFVCIKDISDETGIHRNDIISTLQVLGIIKYWKGRNLILKRTNLAKELARLQRRKPKKHPDLASGPKPIEWHVDAACLRWTPRNRRQNFAPPPAP